MKYVVKAFCFTQTSSHLTHLKVESGQVVWSRRGFGGQQLVSHGLIKLVEDSRLLTFVLKILKLEIDV